MTVTNDTDNNGYRDLILPLAYQDPLVQRAVMVVSALHLGTYQTPLRHQAEMGRTAILTRMRQDVLKGHIEDVLNVPTLATLLILLVGETVTGSSDFVHLFSMLRSLMTLQNDDILGSQAMSKFLDYQRRMYVSFTIPQGRNKMSTEEDSRLLSTSFSPSELPLKSMCHPGFYS
jgi:hypothetical protein